MTNVTLLPLPLPPHLAESVPRHHTARKQFLLVSISVSCLVCWTSRRGGQETERRLKYVNCPHRLLDIKYLSGPNIFCALFYQPTLASAVSAYGHAALSCCTCPGRGMSHSADWAGKCFITPSRDWITPVIIASHASTLHKYYRTLYSSDKNVIKNHHRVF